MNYLMLVNKENPIPSDYNVDLVDVNSKYKEGILLEKETYKNFLKLQEFLKTKNINIEINSGYRTSECQANLFGFDLEKNGYIHALEYIAIPRHSEHETGLALDFVLFKDDKFIEEHDLKNLKELDIIHKSIQDFGFILRYPKDKKEITGYNYEPWHLRYVGTYAKNIMDNNLTLEEYLTK